LDNYLFKIILSLRIFTALDFGKILYALNPGKYKDLHSARVQAQKNLNEFVSLGHLERGNGYYRIPGCQSEYGDHARLLTQALAELLKLNLQITIYREHSIPECGLRPDAICLINKDNLGLCFILEVLCNESHEYFLQKINTWKHWQGANKYLSDLFSVEIPHFAVVAVGKCYEPSVIPFEELLREVQV
jgi:hypothetical protein